MNAAHVTLVTLLLALAGCASDAPEHSMEHGHDHGAFYTCPDGTVLDPGDYSSHHDSDFDVASKCPMGGAPASVTLVAEPANIQFYGSTSLRWDVTPAHGDAGTISAIIISATAMGATTTLAQPTERQAPVSGSTDWEPDAPGSYTVRVAVTIDGEEVESDPVIVEVQEIPASGVVHTVTVTPLGPVAALDPADLQIELGDAVVWENDDILPHSFHATGGPVDFATDPVDFMATSGQVVFLRLGDTQYEDEDGGLSGTIHVTAPS